MECYFCLKVFTFLTDIIYDFSHVNMNWSWASCYAFELFVETMPQLFHNASIWCTLVLAVQRYIYICQATRYFIFMTRLHYLTHNITEPDTW